MGLDMHFIKVPKSDALNPFCIRSSARLYPEIYYLRSEWRIHDKIQVYAAIGMNHRNDLNNEDMIITPECMNYLEMQKCHYHGMDLFSTLDHLLDSIRPTIHDPRFVVYYHPDY